ncbi:hypothetical protein [Streptomyces sp. NPDC026589]|uniref:hypothetical protein n=1 Tax=Streptomyces sp. NPDC026589 TaxID=3155609 RepID=UPI0034099C26
MVQELMIALVAVLCAGALYVASAARVIRQYERGVVLRPHRPHRSRPVLIGTAVRPSLSVAAHARSGVPARPIPSPLTWGDAAGVRGVRPPA